MSALEAQVGESWGEVRCHVVESSRWDAEGKLQVRALPQVVQGNLTVGQEEEWYLGKEDRVVLEGDAVSEFKMGEEGGEERKRQLCRSFACSPHFSLDGIKKSSPESLNNEFKPWVYRKISECFNESPKKSSTKSCVIYIS